MSREPAANLPHALLPAALRNPHKLAPSLAHTERRSGRKRSGGSAMLAEDDAVWMDLRARVGGFTYIRPTELQSRGETSIRRKKRVRRELGCEVDLIQYRRSRAWH